MKYPDREFQLATEASSRLQRHCATRLVDHLMNMDYASTPRMKVIKNFALLSAVGVPASACTTTNLAYVTPTEFVREEQRLCPIGNRRHPARTRIQLRSATLRKNWRYFFFFPARPRWLSGSRINVAIVPRRFLDRLSPFHLFSSSPSTSLLAG